jgi:hypothetical protein
MTQYPYNENNDYELHETHSVSDDDDDDDDANDDIIADEQIMDDDIYEAKIVNKKTYIGAPIINNTTNLILFGCHISAQSFYKYPLERICDFLKTMSCSNDVLNNGLPEIMQLIQIPIYHNNNSVCAFNSIVMKTIWLRIIQRRWKKLMQQRNRVIQGRTTMRNIRHLEITGHHLPEYSVLPRLQGCLYDLV